MGQVHKGQIGYVNRIINLKGSKHYGRGKFND
jgi:hypothetical protein